MKIILSILVFFCLSFNYTNSDVWYGDSIMFGNELAGQQYSHRYPAQYSTLSGRSQNNYAQSGATLQSAWGSNSGIFSNIATGDLASYTTGDRFFFGYGVNDYIRAKGHASNPTLATIIATLEDSLEVQIDRIHNSLGFPYSSIVVVGNYLQTEPAYEIVESEFEQIVNAMMAVADAKGCTRLNWFAFWKTRGDITWANDDKIHPDAAANTIMANNLNATLQAPTPPPTPIEVRGRRYILN